MFHNFIKSDFSKVGFKVKVESSKFSVDWVKIHFNGGSSQFNCQTVQNSMSPKCRFLQKKKIPSEFTATLQKKAPGSVEPGAGAPKSLKLG